MPNPNYSGPPYVSREFVDSIRQNAAPKFELNVPPLNTYMVQIGDDEPRDFLCIEAATAQEALDQAKEIRPGRPMRAWWCVLSYEPEVPN